MPRAAEVGVAKSDYGIVRMLVAGAILVCSGLVLAGHVVRNGVGIGAQLHSSERNAGSREGVSHPVSSDKWVNVTDMWPLAGGAGRNAYQSREKGSFYVHIPKVQIIFIIFVNHNTNRNRIC